MNNEVLLYDKRGHQIRTEVRTEHAKAEAFRYLEAQARNVRSAFKAAEQDRTNANWVTTSQSINTILMAELARMRARGRWFERNNSYAGSAINSFLNYVVGTGFDLQMAITSMVQDPATGNFEKQDNDPLNELIEDLFKLWSEDVSIHASTTSPDSWFDVQDLLLRRWIVDGEIFVHMVVDKSHDVVPFVLEIIDADQLDVNTTENPENGNQVFLGVELDKLSWRPVAYWIHSTANQDPRLQINLKSVRVPAEDMVHIFAKHFPLQVRGIPFFAGVTNDFFQLNEYRGAQLIRNKIAALFSVLITGGAEGGGFFKDDDTSGTQNSVGFPVDADGNVLANLAVGTIGRLPEGYDVKQVNPTAPEASYEPFVQDQLRAMGAGIEFGLSYTSLTRDTTKTTFAGGRQAENMDIQGYRRLSKKFSGKGLSPIMRKWEDTAVASGAITIPGYFLNPRRWQRHLWLGSGWARGINPLQEVMAKTQSMEAFLTSLPLEASLQGLEYKQILRDAEKVLKDKERRGLNTSIEAGESESDVNASAGVIDEDDATRAMRLEMESELK